MFEQLKALESTKKDNLDRFTSTSSPENDFELSSTIKIVLQNLDRMTGIFFFEDDLLGSEGPIPVYYWFIRNLDLKHDWEVRDFLETFTVWLKAKDKTAVHSPELVVDLETYSTALRSVNDKSSHEKRFELLRKWFEIWRFGLNR